MEKTDQQVNTSSSAYFQVFEPFLRPVVALCQEEDTEIYVETIIGVI